MKTVFYFSLFYLICLHAMWKEGAMKFAGKQMRKCYNPTCSTITSRTEEVRFKNGRVVVVHACLDCHPVPTKDGIDWRNK